MFFASRLRIMSGVDILDVYPVINLRESDVNRENKNRQI